MYHQYQAAITLGVNERTLRRWEEQGKITAFRTPGGQRRYDISGLTTKSSRLSIIYARVSSPKQREDLQRQRANITRKVSLSASLHFLAGSKSRSFL